jgi:hypothetical protein
MHVRRELQRALFGVPEAKYWSGQLDAALVALARHYPLV